jgi:predicted aminopeptidase
MAFADAFATTRRVSTRALAVRAGPCTMRAMRWWWGAAIGIAGAVLAACAGLGGRVETAKVRWQRVPLERALKEPEPTPEAHARIVTVMAVRSYAAGIGIAVGERFATLSRSDLDRPGFVLTASERWRLHPYSWPTPPAGTLPYKGFDDRQLARDDATRLEEAGYDTEIRTDGAFRSFPWLPPPLLPSHLRRDHVPLARLVLRELYRDTFTLPGGHAVAFNESLANFVAHRGAIEVFRERGPAADPARLRQAEVAWKAERRFATYLGRLTRDLEAAYALSPDAETALAAKARILDGARADLESLSAHFERMGLPAFEAPRNNAALLSRLRRTKDLDVFEAVYERTRDLRRTLDVIEWEARAQPDNPLGALRSALALEPREFTSRGDAHREAQPSGGRTEWASPSSDGDPGTPASSAPRDPAPPTPGA